MFWHVIQILFSEILGTFNHFYARQTERFSPALFSWRFIVHIISISPSGSRFDIWLIGHIRCLNSDLRVGACEWYFHAEELEQVWGRKLVDMAFRLTDYGQKLNLTREETAALRSVSLTFPGMLLHLL